MFNGKSNRRLARTILNVKSDWGGGCSWQVAFNGKLLETGRYYSEFSTW